MEQINQHISSGEKWIPGELGYLQSLILFRMDKYFPSDHPEPEPELDVERWELPIANFVRNNRANLTDDEAVILLIAMVPHIKPDLFDSVIQSKLARSGDFPKIGGVKGRNARMFLPTGETVLFLLAGEDLEKRLQLKQYFGAETIFWQRKILWLEDMQDGEPSMHGRLILSQDYVDLLTYGSHRSPQFSISFPAKKIAPVKEDQNPPTFDDLVIPDDLKEQIGELESWLKFNKELMIRYGMKKTLKKGYRALFYGPPGTGKTFTAEILGNHLGREVFKIDLSMVVSKYIGETEKNLELLFSRAEDKGWILFFDEADALFGKRTNVRDAHDKYANQEVSYLLQRIEDYDGLVILATNMKNNIDEAFIRRFNSILKFPFPDPAQRAMIWKKVLPRHASFRKKIITGNPPSILEEEADIPEMVKKYELTGGNIINVVQYACIKALEALYESKSKIPDYAEMHEPGNHDLNGIKKPDPPEIHDDPIESGLVIYLSDILEGIKKEMLKEGKPFQ